MIWNGTIKPASGKAWNINCQYDAVKDTRLCSLRNGCITLYSGNSNIMYPRWGGSLYPGSKLVWRTDSDQPFEIDPENTSDLDADLVFLSMLTREKIRTRWYDWPYEQPQDAECDLAGFKDAASAFSAIKTAFIVQSPH